MATTSEPVPADSPEVDSPLFNYSNVDDSQPLFSIATEDEDPHAMAYLSDPAFTERPNKRSVMSAVEVEGLAESDFKDRGRVADKPAKDFARITQQIKNIVLFEGFDNEELKLVAEYMYVRRVVKGEVVIKIGSVGDAIYVVKSGSYKCVMPGPDGKDVTVKTYKDEGHFGELALINHAPRAATITALTNGELWVLQALRHSWLRKQRAKFNGERFEKLLKAIPLFRNNLNPSLSSRLIDALEVVTMSPGEVICKQGDPGDAMYFVMKGEVDVSINNKSVRVMSKNEFFGERALVMDEGRAATCSAKTSVSLAKLARESFQLLIPDPVVSKMRQHIYSNYEKSTVSINTGAKSPAAQPPGAKTPAAKPPAPQPHRGNSPHAMPNTPRPSSATSLAEKPASPKSPGAKPPTAKSPDSKAHTVKNTPSQIRSSKSLPSKFPPPKSPPPKSPLPKSPPPKSPPAKPQAAPSPAAKKK